MPSSVPHVDEVGVTSAPLKSASFFLGEYCKPYNGQSAALPCCALVVAVAVRTRSNLLKTG